MGNLITAFMTGIRLYERVIDALLFEPGQRDIYDTLGLPPTKRGKVSLEVGWISLAHNFAEEVGNRPKKECG
jgi:hypothetical protein